jgi:hypothetical protein
MNLGNLKQLVKEELRRALKESMFKVGEEVMYGGKPRKVVSDDGYIIKLEATKDNKEATLNYAQAKQKIRKQTDYMNENNPNQETTNYTPGGFTTDTESPWMSLPPGKYEVTYKPMLPLSAVKTYTLDFPNGKEFDNYGEARKYYYSNQPKYSEIEDRMKTLVKVTKIA